MRRFYFKLKTKENSEIECRVNAMNGKHAKEIVLKSYEGCIIIVGPVELPR